TGQHQVVAGRRRDGLALRGVEAVEKVGDIHPPILRPRAPRLRCATGGGAGKVNGKGPPGRGPPGKATDRPAGRRLPHITWWSCRWLWLKLAMSLSVQAMPSADRMNTTWMMVCHSTPSVVRALQREAPMLEAAVAISSGGQNGRPLSTPAAMKVFSRWIEEIPMIAIASLTFS